MQIPGGAWKDKYWTYTGRQNPLQWDELNSIATEAPTRSTERFELEATGHQTGSEYFGVCQNTASKDNKFPKSHQKINKTLFVHKKNVST